MYIKKLAIKNYRNYSDLSISLSKNVNVFTGDNAQGKTNILESIYYCSLGRSHRTSKDKELIKWNEGYGEIVLDVARERLDKKIDIKFSREGKKSITINSIRLRKISELIGVFNAVIFSPEDLKVVKESASFRRKFLDIELSKLKPKYYTTLVSYNKVLSERNTVLKTYNDNLEEILEIYDRQLAKLGSIIVKQRILYLQKLQQYGEKIHSDITKNKEKINFRYISDLKSYSSLESDLYELISKNRSRDINKRITSKGPHRDDFLIDINGVDTRVYGSQGQQRTAILTIKFASLEIIKEFIGEYPVLLLDDVLSELDVNRQSFILNSLKNVQTIITCTGMETIRNYLKDDFKLFMVKEGSIEKIIEE